MWRSPGMWPPSCSWSSRTSTSWPPSAISCCARSGETDVMGPVSLASGLDPMQEREHALELVGLVGSVLAADRVTGVADRVLEAVGHRLIGGVVALQVRPAVER